MNRPSWTHCAPAALLALILGSCGGGGVGTGGTGFAMGTVTGFGSLLVDGQAYSSATPTYYAGTSADESTPVSAAAVELGGQLQLQLDANGSPTTVVVEPELEGTVAQLSANPQAGFVVNGVPVHVNADPTLGPVTYYSGLPGYGGLAGGMNVEVHGAFGIDAAGQGYVAATLIEQQPATNRVTRVTGLVSGLDPVRGTFLVGTTPVQLAASATVLPAGAALANGQVVSVWSNVPSTGALSVAVVRIRTLQGLSGPVRLGGLVAQPTDHGFQIGGIPVDAGAPGLATALAGLVPGQYVVVTGQVRAATGVVTASAIQAGASQPAPAALHGTITGFVSASSFLVRGVPVDASQATYASAAAAASLRNGVYVDILGSIAGNTVRASSVAIEPAAPVGATAEYVGVVGQFVPGSSAFVLTLPDGTQRSIGLAANVAFGDGTLQQLANGANVEVEGTVVAGGLSAYRVSFQRLGAPPEPGGAPGGALQTSGPAYAVTPTAFTVNGLVIQVNGVTPQGGSLVDGANVEVTFSVSGGQNLAQAISIDD